ncbi:MAG: hypothetical protein KJ737_11685 [Proteobacteria bacterium]|nr:hypothetical protein [Pseudomonadota bacterium]
MAHTNTHIFKQALGFQKTIFDNAFNLLVRYQDNTEELTNSILDRYLNVPEEWRQEVGKWSKNLKDGRVQLKKIVDEGFSKAGDIVAH